MNTWRLSGKPVSVYVEFKKDGEFVPPDPGSIKLTVRDHTGIPFSGYDQASQPDTTLTTSLIVLPQNLNIINSGWENRHVWVEFTSGGVPCVFKSSYKLSFFIPFNASPSDVRNTLGVRDKELKDEEVDLYEAYFKLEEVIPSFNVALLDTGLRGINANKALVLFAALELIPSMPVRVAKTDILNNAQLTRATIDWDQLEAKLRAELAGIVLLIPENPTSIILSAVFALSQPVDVITNA